MENQQPAWPVLSPFLVNPKRVFLAVSTFAILLNAPIVDAEFSMTILHTGDIHARFQQFDRFAGTCSTTESDNGECYGGFSRLQQAINEIRDSETNVILLDAGDVFTGTLWFTLYEGRASSHFMNRLGYDAQALGNHEFDKGVEVLSDYLDSLNASVVAANIDVSEEPLLDGLYTPSTVITVGGERIGIVGYILPGTKRISSSGNVIFYEEIDAIQDEVDRLLEDGVNKIIALGHSGFIKDQEIAAKVRGVDIVIGGHTSTFLYTVTSDDGAIVPVVHPYDFGKYLGRLDVTFDDDGKLIEYEGNPILLNNEVERDAATLSEIMEWAVGVENVTLEVIGETHVHLDGDRNNCRLKECNLGNMITDAYLWQLISFPDAGEWNDVAIIVVNGGGIRSSVPQGKITRGDVLQVLPFGDTLDVLDLKGEYVKDMLEHSVANHDPEELDGGFLQMSGIWVTYDLSRDVGDRVVDVLVRCTNCSIPEFMPLDEDKMYRIGMPGFIARGGDGYDVIPANAQNQYSGNVDSDILADYVRWASPVYPGIERRITFIGEDDKACDDGKQQSGPKMRKRIP